MLALVSAFGATAVLISGLHMALRPAAYLGRGTIQATDPRTVRWFGIFFLAIGVPALILLIVRLA
ncbi:MAG: hypothetical protein QOH81_2179 [Sphingomonadales bacterium]|jgi:hypothetical protein|nr:hypothetical protein [Sphingomonadales bacterium]